MMGRHVRTMVRSCGNPVDSLGIHSCHTPFRLFHRVGLYHHPKMWLPVLKHMYPLRERTLRVLMGRANLKLEVQGVNFIYYGTKTCYIHSSAGTTRVVSGKTG